MKTYTICGSMCFEKQMREIACYLETERGFNILQCTYSEKALSEEAAARIARSHYRKIDISDGIYVVNIGGYIGEAVQAEIAYAQKTGKQILYHEK
ncbi:MAG: hypothetical protein J6J12_10415 [Oscillospiraceae bacterium]|nr:hypothetical protein [Oscillospiraceae bacterium]